MSSFAELVKNELVRARAKHPSIMHSTHEAYGIILEEVDEFWDLCKQQYPKDEFFIKEFKSSMLKELVQVAAMCQKAAEDLDLQLVRE